MIDTDLGRLQPKEKNIKEETALPLLKPVSTKMQGVRGCGRGSAY